MNLKKIGFFILLMIFTFHGCKQSTTADSSKDETSRSTTITQLEIPGVIAPVRGATPVTTPIDTTQYTGIITWSPSGSPFESSTIYTANIVLTAKTGYTLSGVAANSFVVAGATTTNAANSGTVAAVFPVTGIPADIDVVLSSVTQVGGISNSATTTSLTLNFSADPTSLTASNISVTGATPVF